MKMNNYICNTFKNMNIMKRHNTLTKGSSSAVRTIHSMGFIIPLLLVMLLSGIRAAAQDEFPVVFVKFANPTFDCPTQLYCVEVHVKTDTPGEQIFGFNVRFVYDDSDLEYLGISELVSGYELTGEPEILTGIAGSGGLFGFDGNVEYVYGSIELTDILDNTFTLTAEWQKMFKICFTIDNPIYRAVDSFCPALVWNLQEDPSLGGFFGGFQEGDDGVVISVQSFIDPTESLPTTENVEQFNWIYQAGANSYGVEDPVTCVSTKCGTPLPLSDWAIYLAIGLMAAASVFIYRRRIG